MLAISAATFRTLVPPPPMDRGRVALLWLLTNVACSLFFSFCSLIVWDLVYVPKPNVEWRPIADIVDMVLFMPLGWAISLVTPAGWLNLAGLAIALKSRDAAILLLSVIGATFFGMCWPMFFGVVMRA